MSHCILKSRPTLSYLIKRPVSYRNDMPAGECSYFPSAVEKRNHMINHEREISKQD
jgi:hypothetical protein